MELAFADNELFTTKAGIKFPGFSSSKVLELRDRLGSEFGLIPAQITEAASYSFAMVVRFALGLSAEGGNVCALVSDNLEGWIALGTLRHLRNAGANCLVIEAGTGQHSEHYELQKRPLSKMGIQFYPWSAPEHTAENQQRIQEIHTVLCGLGSGIEGAPLFPAMSEVLNELSTPIYVVGGPPGVDLATGKPGPHAFFASCTLSLGAPIATLNPAADYTGRHYLCDLSIPRELYQECGFDLSPLFAEQPVIQIFPFGKTVADGKTVAEE